MKLNIHLVTWNGSKYIPYLFESLRNQTFKDWKLVVLDNASSDDTVEKIKHELENFPFEHELIVNQENKGFAGGHNQLWNEERGMRNEEFILILNQDLYLQNDCIEKMFNFLERHSEVAALAPRTMKWQFNEGKFGNVVDSLGLKIYRNRRVVEVGEGEEYENMNREFDYVFGVSGAVVLFRKRVIDEIGFLDETFQSYKEDVDLAYRINISGCKSAVLYDAVVYHDRAGGGTKHKDDYSALKNKIQQKPWVKYHSYKNHLMTLYKNEYWQNFLLDLPWIKWYELKKFIYFLLFDRSILKGLGEIWQMRKELKKKRVEIKKIRKINWRELRKWWG